MRIALLHEWLPASLSLKAAVLVHAGILFTAATLCGVFIGSLLPGAAIPFLVLSRYTLASLDDLPISQPPS